MSIERPWAYSAFRVVVAARRTLSPHFVRLTFTGDDLAHFAEWGTDQRIKLVLPLPDGTIADIGLLDEPTPHPSDWYTRWKALPEEQRNVLRTYTPAGIRPDRREIDVDFYLHDPAGPASAWAATASPGDAAVITGPDRRMGWTGYGLHWIPGEATRFLLVADETAFPAARNILRAMPDGSSADVVLECADAADDTVTADATLPAAVRDRARFRIVPRGSAQPTGAERAVAEWADDQGRSAAGDPNFYAWIAGETGTTTRIRRFLTTEAGIPKEQVSFLGYWRVGGPLTG